MASFSLLCENAGMRSETYFVDGHRQPRHLTRHLPIFEIHCTRTGLLKYSDMRVMRDRAPKDSVRIMGYAVRRASNQEWPEVPGANVGISGPAGEVIVTSNQRDCMTSPDCLPAVTSCMEWTPRQDQARLTPFCEGRETHKAGVIRECGDSGPVIDWLCGRFVRVTGQSKLNWLDSATLQSQLLRKRVEVFFRPVAIPGHGFQRRPSFGSAGARPFHVRHGHARTGLRLQASTDVNDIVLVVLVAL